MPPSPWIAGVVHAGVAMGEGHGHDRSRSGDQGRGPRRSSGLDRFFKITERGSSVRTEIIAGLATWLTMAYILFVNPAILGSVKDSAGTTLTFPRC